MNPEERKTHGWQLVTAAQAGDHTAFSQLWNIHRPEVGKVIAAMVRNRSEVDDLVGDVAVKAWRNIHRITDQGVDVAAWFCVIARNRARDHLKCSRVRLTTYAEDLNDDSGSHEWIYPPAPGPGDAVPEVLNEDETTARLRFYLHRLNPQQRRCLELRYFTGLDCEDTARALGVNVGAAKARQHRAQTNLAEMLHAAGYRTSRDFLTDTRNDLEDAA